MDFTTEQTEKAKNCKTLDEFKELAKTEGFDFTEEEAKACFQATRADEISEDDLNSVAGGKGHKSKFPPQKFKVGEQIMCGNVKGLITDGGVYDYCVKEWKYEVTDMSSPTYKQWIYESQLLYWCPRR